jgi:hypothetical protein
LKYQPQTQINEPNTKLNTIKYNIETGMAHDDTAISGKAYTQSPFVLRVP